MENIGKVTDEDFGLEVMAHAEPPMKRFGARGIVLNDTNQIAVFFKMKKNEYKLPGGGIDQGEDAILAFKRECEEEIGCEIEVVRNLGTILEVKSHENFEQLSYVFVAKVVKDYGALNLTQQEQDEGAGVVWMGVEDALKVIKNSLENLVASKYDSVYRTQFMVMRDVKILKKYLNQL